MTPQGKPELGGKRVVVVGAARSGLAIARFCAAQGADVVLTDKKPAAALGAPPPGVRVEAGGHVPATFEAADIVVLSPGVPELAETQVARVAGAWITGEVELAARFIEADFIGITGTNGKSTTTALTGLICERTGRPTFTGGNLGEPLSTCLGTPAAARGGIVVCELSSFQLETAEALHPRAAANLNVTPDHLDRYAGMQAYADAKGLIYRRQTPDDVAIYNADDPWCEPQARRGQGRLLAFSSSREVARGAFLAGREIVLRDGADEERLPVDDLQIVGTHNLENAMAAYLCARAVGARTETLRAAAHDFKALPHRMELVGEAGGVRFYDDSKGTNVGAVVKALDGFPRPVVLIAGGRDKGGDYGPMRDALAPVARGVVLIGEAADKIAVCLGGAAYPVVRAGSMDDAVRAAAGLARSGDAVVLSPACSSYDMFKNFEHRGQVFRAAVSALEKFNMSITEHETASVQGQVATPAPPRAIDLWLLGAVLFLLGGGTVIIYSSSAVFATQTKGDAVYFVKRHLIYLTVGGFALWLGARVHYTHYRRWAYHLLAFGVASLAAVLVIGSRVNGARRWFRLGPASFQPAELAKLALVIYLAYSLAKKAEKVKQFTVGFLPHLMIAGVMMALLLKQPDLGNAIILGTTTLVILFVAGAKVSYLAIALLGSAPVVYYAIVGTPWRMQRMLAFLDPWQYRHGVGYQITESLISIGSGGMWGLGLGEGKQKLFFLPEAHTDFIAASLGEELGFIGLCAVMLLALVIVVRGIRASMGARDPFGMYLGFGLTGLFGMQTLVNLGVVMGVLPAKGLPLPLLSFGGTSLVFYLFSIGIILNIGMRAPVPAPGRKWWTLGALRRAHGERMARRRRRTGPVVFSRGGDPDAA